MQRLLIAASLLALSACASLPTPLQGSFLAISPTEAGKAPAQGQPVRWGGRIVAVDNYADRSCFKILSIRLDASGRPLAEDHSDGRFIACRSGFYDPAVFAAEREITITGRIEAIELGRIGELEYPYPRLAADVVYLWPERREVDVIVERHPFWW